MHDVRIQQNLLPWAINSLELEQKVVAVPSPLTLGTGRLNGMTSYCSLIKEIVSLMEQPTSFKGGNLSKDEEGA